MTEQPVPEEAVCRECGHDHVCRCEEFPAAADNFFCCECDKAGNPDVACHRFVPKGEQAARAYVTDADGARPLVVEPDSPLGRAWEGDETFTEAAGESRVEAAEELWVAHAGALLGLVSATEASVYARRDEDIDAATARLREARRRIEAAVADKARQEADVMIANLRGTKYTCEVMCDAAYEGGSCRCSEMFNELPAVANDLAAAEAARDQMAEALRRYMRYCETFGEEDLRAEFGPPEHEGSSGAMEEWLDRVLRIPARAALASTERGEEPLMTDDTTPQVTPEEAEAREAVLGMMLGDGPPLSRAENARILDAYRDAIRGSDKERIAALEAGIREALIETNHYRAAGAGTTDNGHTSPGLRANNILRALLTEAPVAHAEARDEDMK